MNMASDIESIPFLKVGKNLKFEKNVDINHPQSVVICNGVTLATNSLICVNVWWYNKEQECNIFIDDYVYVGRNSIIEAFNKIIIGKGVLIGPNVYIADNSHEYRDFKIGIGEQGRVDCLNTILINDGVWIGAGTTIIGNLTIGFGSVVAANSFVNKDVPNHCVVAGNPIKIIKVCDYKRDEWINVKNNKTLSNKILNNRGEFKGYPYYQSLRNENVQIIKKSKYCLDNFTNKVINNLELALESVSNNDLQLSFNNIIQVTEVFNNVQNITKESLNEEDKKSIIVINSYLNSIIESYNIDDSQSIIRIIRVELIPIFSKWFENISKYTMDSENNK